KRGINHAPVSIRPASDSLWYCRGIVLLFARRGVFSYRTRRSVAVDYRTCVLRRASRARSADLSSAVCGMPREYDGKHHWTTTGGRQFPFQLERAVPGESCRQDSEDDAVRSAREPFSTAVHRPCSIYTPGRQVPCRISRSERVNARTDYVSCRANFSGACGHFLKRRSSSPVGRKPCRADESHRFSKCEHHI